VEYNRTIKQTLSIQLTDTFTFTQQQLKVLCAKFSRDGRYLALGLDNGETRLHDMTRKSGFSNTNSIISVLAARRVGDAETPSKIWAVAFSVDNQLVATGGSKHEINVCV
jgi:WD40 repeat protein